MLQVIKASLIQEPCHASTNSRR